MIDIECTLGGRRYRVGAPVDLSRPVTFGEGGVNAFGLPDARRAPVRMGAFVGGVKDGGPCDCPTLEIVPHGNGTHTECVGHIVEDEVFVTALPDWVGATLVTCAPEPRADTEEGYAGEGAVTDLVVTARALHAALERTGRGAAFLDALVVRTGLGLDGPTRLGGQNPPYLTADCIAAIDALGCTHLLVDLPSIDRESDGGTLPNHRAYWRAPARALDGAPSARTITELCAVPADLDDGAYLLELMVPAIEADAVPSRPRLRPVTAVDATRDPVIDAGASVPEPGASR